MEYQNNLWCNNKKDNTDSIPPSTVSFYIYLFFRAINYARNNRIKSRNVVHLASAPEQWRTKPLIVNKKKELRPIMDVFING